MDAKTCVREEFKDIDSKHAWASTYQVNYAGFFWAWLCYISLCFL